MTGQELYYKTAPNQDVTPWNKLPKLIKEYYEKCSSSGRGNDHTEQGEPVHKTEHSCCGGCSGLGSQC